MKHAQKRRTSIAILLLTITSYSIAAGGQQDENPEQPAPSDETLHHANSEETLDADTPQRNSDHSGLESPRGIQIWDLALEPNDDDQFLSELADRLSSGFLPVGLHFEAGRPPLVLYAINLGLDVVSIALQLFENPDTTRDDLATLIEDGWLPMTIAHNAGDLVSIMVRSDVEIRDWGMAFVPFDRASIETEISRRGDEGYSLWALSNSEDQAWLFFIQEAVDAPEREYLVVEYIFDHEVYIPGIDEAVGDGWYPWAITVLDGTMMVILTRTPEE